MNKEQKKILANKDSFEAFRYARDVIQRRWPEAEEFIRKRVSHAVWYSEEVIKGRWPEAEETISKYSDWAYDYASDVIKGRWPEAEETISKDPDWASRYTKNFINGQRSAVLETNYLCDTSQCEYHVVKDYLSKIDWADPANDFPIPKRLKHALKSTLKKAEV